ncbi:TonB-dependent receptor [Halioxenophilus aromaticivorans]|uniref:TonB-dependent receptor plug domain-containing protein n=1 Tax=Halioxenophilus aromaticivorans TaxID=1306992 RepID=A0AAV3TXQ8_9ALTE
MNQLNNRQRLWRRRFPNTTFTSLLLAASVAAPYGTVTAAQIEEIVVTAQKREQGSQDIGAAITAFGSDQLAKSDFNNIGDLQAMAPSLQIGESFGFAQIMIRGIGTDNPFAGGDPSVAMHIDGVVTGQSSAQFGSLFDIERVEVLRGPQGTLYGRNATGGSINVITQKPSEELNGYARVTVGNYELAKLEAAAGGALTDGVMGRIAVRALDRGGYGENIADGGDIDDAKQQSIRGQLLFEPSDTVSMRVSAERHEEDDTNYIPKFRSPSYDTAPLPALEPQPVDGTRASDPRDINSNVDLQNEREQASYSLEANWDINEVFSLTSLSNYQTFEKTPQADFDMTEVDFYIWSESFETEQTSQELQFNFSTDRVKGIVGFFYYHE